MNWFGRKFRNAPNDKLCESGGELGDFAEHLGDWCEGEYPGSETVGFVPNPEATLVTSLKSLTMEPFGDNIEFHAPVLDLDIEHVYYPSTTPGHAALLLNVDLTWDQYSELIDVLESCGIIQYGFAEATRQRGYSACRTPWTKKPKRAEPCESDPDPMTENVFD